MGLSHCSGDLARHNHNVVRIESAFLVGCAAFYIISQVWLKPYHRSDFFQSHLNDVTAGGALSAFSIMLIRQRFQPSFAWVAAFTLIIVSAAGCYWEWVTPLYRATSVSDPLDIAAYFAGACLYLAFEFIFHCIRLKPRSCKDR